MSLPPGGAGPEGIIFEGTYGYPLNINLLGSSSLGDFLPPSPVLGGSSVALLPPGAAGAPTGWRGLERPVHAGAVDLITGMPLARVSELELPFAGATFRLVRTRSHSQRVEAYTCAGDPVVDAWWDWAGDGWMISESPLLLIDSAVPDMVGNGPRTTYLILDAHHSIPFMKLEDSGTYEAPARFRARITHNGQNWNPALSDWIDTSVQPPQPTRPTRYTVSLYDGALTYTFLVVREDVPDNRWDKTEAGIACGGAGDPCLTVSSLHDRPFLPQQFGGSKPNWNPRELGDNPGQGVPYYGLCTRIEDQYGHIVDISFGNQTQFALDNPQTPYPDDPPLPDCVECMQDCPGKGQIRSIRLTKREGSTPTVHWTLLYRYRIAPRVPWDGIVDECPNEFDLFPWEHLIPTPLDHFGTRVLDSIFVYRGDETGADTLPPAGYSVSTTSRLYDGTGDPTVAALDHDDTSVPVPANWLHRVRYHYGFQFSDNDPNVGEQEGMLDKAPRLLKISVASRTETEQGPPSGPPSSVRSWLFEYYNAVRDGGEAWLAAVYEPDAVDRAVAAARVDDAGAGVNRVALALDANARLNWLFVGTLDLPDIQAAATVRWTPGAVAGVSDPGLMRGYLPDGRPHYIRTDQPVAEVDFWNQFGDGQAGTLALAGPNGEARYFRFRRFNAGEEIALDDGRPHRTAFHAPYTWRGWHSDSTLYQTPDYTKPRWITMIDEFADKAAMENAVTLETTGYFLPENTDSKSKLISRRVVHIGPSGVVLRDHQWLFKDGEFVESSGSGLGAENTYWPVAAFLDEAGMALPDVPLGLPDPYGYGLIMPPVDPFAHLRHELLLMERRSVGWSVADNAGQGLSQGFVQFYEYEALRFDTEPHSEGYPLSTGEGWYSDDTARVELRAEGVKQGQAYTRVGNGPLIPNDDPTGPRLYTREIFRSQNPADPGGLPAGWPQPEDPGQWEYVCEARYLVPTLELERLQPGQLPAPGAAPPMTTGSRPEPRLALSYALTKREPEPLDPAEYAPAYARAIQSTIAIGPAQQQRPGGHWYFPAERQQFDEDGKLTWTASGLVRNPVDPSAVTGDELQSLAHTVQVYDDEGRTRHVIADVDVQAGGQLPAASVLNVHAGYQRPEAAEVTDAELAPLAAHWPAGWPRIGIAPARNYVLTSLFAASGGRLSDVYYPNGRRWASRIVPITVDEGSGDPLRPRDLVWNVDNYTGYGNLTVNPPEQWFAREYIFNEIETRTLDPDGPGGNEPTTHPYSRVVGEIRDYTNRDAVGRPAITRSAYFATASDHHVDLQNAVDLSSFLESPEPHEQPRFMEEQRVEYAVDSAGRIARADLLETGPNGISVQIGSERIEDLVDVVRRESFDGTITRVVRNLLGQTVRRYIGTDDDGWLSNNANLALLERVEYGEGVNDAWLPTTVRRYTANPSWSGDPFSDPGSTDADGYATITGYDWRMRPVRVDQFGESATGDRDPTVAPRLTTTLTYRDHADRPIVVATFGAGTLSLPSNLNPVERREWLVPVRPSVADLYGLSLKPTSVVETFYGPEGGTVERRTYHYDPYAPSQQLTWHEEHTYAGSGGQTVYEQRPQQPVSVSTLDGLARTVSSAQLGMWNGTSWEWELGRADYLLDADGNVGATSQFERVVGVGDALAAEAVSGGVVNAVRSRSVAWYDPQQRLTASADLGSESRGSLGTGPDQLIAGPTAYTRQVDDGNASEPWINDAEVSDPLADPIERVELPAWAQLSINRYSMLTGRLVWTANPDGSITQLDYDRAGRLARKTENRFADTASGELSRTTDYEYTLGRLTGIAVSRTPGDPEPGDRQVTRLVYGARLLAHVPAASGSVPPTYADSGVHHASMIGRMHLPVASTGEPSYSPPVLPDLPLDPHDDPNLDTGEVVLRYTFDGMVAERIDARGVVFRYFYDALGRLSWLVVGSYDGAQFTAALPASMLDGSVPVDRVMAIQYLYDASGRLCDVISRTNPSNPSSVLTHTRYEYDLRGNLVREWQGHTGLLGATPPADTAKVDYQWSYEETDTGDGRLGHDRLSSITYPKFPNGTEADRRRVEFAYGAAGTVDDRISRLTAMSSGSNGSFPVIAEFSYAGVSRRTAMTLNPGGGRAAADLRAPDDPNGPVGLSGLDSFGRLRDLRWRNAADQTLLRCEHAYDAAGNRLMDRVTQWPAGGLHDGSGYVLDARSQLHGYDELDRLTGSTVAQLDSSGQPVPGATLREDLWWLDLLGNWQPIAGVPPASLSTGRYSTGNLDGFDPAAGVAAVGGTALHPSYYAWQDPAAAADAAPEDLHLGPMSDGRNEVTGVRFRTDLGQPWDSREVEIRHDAAGNLVFDGTLIYQYDAWGRLVQVSAGAVDPLGTPIAGRPYADLAFGKMLKHHTYDGLGRLIRTQSPFPTPQSAQSGHVRSERYYYDGIRRIQETRLDPSLSTGGALMSGDAELEAMGASALADAQSATGDPGADLELDAATLELENELLALGGPIGGGGPGQTASPVLLVREYVWGPGDAWHPASVDELLVYYGEGRAAYWPLHDASGDIAAVCDAGGAEGAARVVAQQRYDAYGQVLSADHLHPHAFLAVGHKGLFFDRLDRGVSDASSVGSVVPPNSATVETPRLVPFARGIYQVRNRSVIAGGGSPSVIGQASATQSPSGVWVLSQQGLSSGAAVHGRFMQADPNATAMVLMGQVLFHGGAPSPAVDSFDLAGRFGDGPNLFQYLRGNPWASSDPLGTFSYIELGATSLVQGLLAGIFSGAIAEATGGNFWAAFGGGFVGGALGGAAGFAANSAFAASASGLFARLAAHAGVGAASGGAQAFAQTLYDTGSVQQAFANAVWGAAIGAVVGGIADRFIAPVATRFRGLAGELGGRIRLNGTDCEYLFQYAWRGSTLVIDNVILYGPSSAPVNVGVRALREALREYAEDAFNNGATRVIVRYQRLGTTGGVRGRIVEFIIER